DQPEPLAQALGEPRDGGIAIEGRHLGAGLEQGAGVAAGPEGPVDDQLAGRRRKRRHHRLQQHRNVGAVHGPAPARAARWAPRNWASPWRAASRWLDRWAWKASRCQIWKRSPSPTTTTQ